MWNWGLRVRALSLVPALSGCRLLHVTARMSAQAQGSPKKLEPVEIPGLEPITYWDRMHYLPGLADPKCPVWDRGWKDPFHRRGPKYEDMPLYKEKPCYTFHQRTKMLEGVQQALWLTKSKLIEGLPKQILSIAEDPANCIEDQDERVKAAISHARFWTTTEIRPKRDRFCPVLLQDLLHLCRIMQPRYPTLGNRMLAENYRVATMWERESDIFRVCGLNGILLSSKQPLPAAAGNKEILSTESHALPTFYPISPNIDLQQTHVYEVRNDIGFREGYPFPHAHTLYIAESSTDKTRFKPEPLKAKMIMFTFANALARAKLLYGEEPKVLDNPITVQCIATNGRIFQFLVLQLNTTDLQSNDGVKNLIWFDQDQLLYDYAKCRPTIRKKVVQIPAGLSGYCPETFSKFLAMYLHGAV
ncbi:39S ribosomal protein L37, mitochondrial [Scyliorhinus canicula]|uniref:39S ribosomal protein L37, mitochondrial n=1 Tax=Scyliorhinus canicula TaxID=7830 RepID=UPI0018F6774A|nr:39S ribosomal protein L37, mitochondrial [Scyliorhinus canicula]